MRNRMLTTAVLLGSLASQAWGHPGHGVTEDGHSALHYLTDPLHIAPTVVIALAVLWALSRISRRVFRSAGTR